MKYWIDFSGYVKVEADSQEDAEQKFWAQFVQNCHEPFSDDVWDIESIEEVVSFAPPIDVEAFAKDFEDA